MQGVSVRRVPSNEPGAGICVVRLHYSADPTMSADKVNALRAKYMSEARFRREMEIEYCALEGQRLYPEFSSDVNPIPEFDVSDRERWTIWMACDPHPRTAHAMVWEAFNSRGDRAVCGELWPEFGTRYGPQDGVRWKTRDYADAVQLFESDSECKPSPFRWARGKRLHVHRRIMDTYGKASNSDEGDGEDYFATYRRLGVEMTKKAVATQRPAMQVNLNFDAALKGENNLAKAYDSIGRALAARKDAGGFGAPPAMRVFEECYETIDEFENVRYSEETPERLSDEKPVSYQKHCLDCLAYIETARPGFVMSKRAASSWEPLDKDTGY